MNTWVLLGAALAGGLGAGLRYIVDALVSQAVFTGRDRPARFPVGILVVNISGSLLLGLLTGWGTDLIDSDVAWMLGVGLLGGYTTFSTASVDSALLMREGQPRRGWINVFGTLVVCVVAASLGLTLGRLF